MKIVKSRINGKSWVVNSRGKRVTPKYSFVGEYECGPFYFATCHDYSYVKGKKPHRVFVFDSRTENKLDIGNVTDKIQINENVYAFEIEGEWHFYDANMNLLKKGVTNVYTCKKYPYVIATIDEKEYFLNHDLEIVAGPFYSATDFGYFGHAVVAVKENQTVKRTVLSYMDGKLVLKPWSIECDRLETLPNGFFGVRKDGAIGVISPDGKEVLPSIYQEIITKEHHFVIKYKGKFGLADISGKIIFECFYDEIIETPEKFVVKDFARLEQPKQKEIAKRKMG